ncbi:TIGR04190 family B12-binding domain/radical SAM domain protein [Spirochaetota bacterium]
MAQADLVLLHPPSVYDFRESASLYGPISDVVPSTAIFEMYPLGFMTIADYLNKHGFSVRIINIALKMLRSRRFSAEKLIGSLKPLAFGIDLHWLVHAHGGLELAKIIKKIHPHTPVIFGGLSASYFHKELISYPEVDYVVRGDSTEEPLRLLLEVIKQKKEPVDVPNVTWADKRGNTRVNELSHVPTDLDAVSFDYRSMMRSSVKYYDIIGHLPFNNWIKYPIVAILPWKGCVHNCVICGGSNFAYRHICMREQPAYRDPVRIAEDIEIVSQSISGPVIILGDIRHAGMDYAKSLLDAIKSKNIKNHIAIELFSPTSGEFIQMLADAIPNFNIEISPESHDEKVRRAFGRQYDNEGLERTIELALDAGCRRIDLFFMVGLPYQDIKSVDDTITYCEEKLLKNFCKYGEGRVRPFISPLAPFLDPGSLAFEEPEKYGYRLFHKTLEEHRQALLAPSWKYMLNYETRWMSRDEIVNSTYTAALRLNRIKVQYRLLKEKEAQEIEGRTRKAMEYITLIDKIMLDENKDLQGEQFREIREQINKLNNATICKKEELNWPMRFIRFNILKVLQSIFIKETFHGK